MLKNLFQYWSLFLFFLCCWCLCVAGAAVLAQERWHIMVRYTSLQVPKNTTTSQNVYSVLRYYNYLQSEEMISKACLE